MMAKCRSVTVAGPLRDQTRENRIRKKRIFLDARIRVILAVKDSPGSLSGGVPIGGGFRLRSVPRQDFFCRIREHFCHCFPEEKKTGPVSVSKAETGLETCLFIPLWAAEIGGGLGAGGAIVRRGGFGGRELKKNGHKTRKY